MSEANELPATGGLQSEILLYQTEDQKTQIDVRLEGETVWLSQLQMVDLFQTTKQNISLHIRNIFEEGELEEHAVVKEYLTTAADKKQYRVLHYNLDVIISVGYRVKSHRGTQFRIWATQRLREYIVKGFALDDKRLLGGGEGEPLAEDELKQLNLIVDQYLSFAELQAQQKKAMHMADWLKKLHDFLALNDREILTDVGKITHELAKELAEKQFEMFAAKRREFEATHPVSDFDKEVKRIEEKRKKRKQKGNE